MTPERRGIGFRQEIKSACFGIRKEKLRLLLYEPFLFYFLFLNETENKTK
jgi:hypothetical protein